MLRLWKREPITDGCRRMLERRRARGAITRSAISYVSALERCQLVAVGN
jgi:hypothetical protein